jgi:hypothetical protein
MVRTKKCTGFPRILPQDAISLFGALWWFGEEMPDFLVLLAARHFALWRATPPEVMLERPSLVRSAAPDVPGSLEDAAGALTNHKRGGFAARDFSAGSAGNRLPGPALLWS